MKKVSFKFILCVLLSFCSKEKSVVSYKEFLLSEDVKILVPFQKNVFSDTLMYSHIEIWIGSKKVFNDSSLTEYLFNNSHWPQANKLSTGEYEILIPIFDAPDLNKIFAFYFKNNVLIRKDTLPFLEQYTKSIDDCDKKLYVGIMHLIEAYVSEDSCYYNPTLFYVKTEHGLRLDSAFTIRNAKEQWGDFYGYAQLNKVFPCK